MILSQIITIAGYDPGYEIDYTYYDGGEIKTIQYPEVPGGSRETVTYTYDRLGQPFGLIGSQTYVDDAAWTAGRCGWCARSEAETGERPCKERISSPESSVSRGIRTLAVTGCSDAR